MIKLADITGRILLWAEPQITPQPGLAYPLSLSDIPAGTYALTVESETGSGVKTLTIIR